jgi:hypothetical protein
MKKILLSLVAIATIGLTAFGQSPEGFKYQAVIRDAGTELTNQAVGIRMTIQQGSIGGTAVYQETFAPTSNAYGLVNLEIGKGTTTDDFAAIDWSSGSYFIETAVDITGGITYTVMGTSQLMSVPYALHAKTAGNGITTAQSAAITANTAKESVTAAQATILGNTSGTNTGDQDGSETKLQGSTNITVTGDGTSGSPYIVSSSDIADLLIELEALKNRVAVLEGGSTPYNPGVSVQDNLDNGVSILDLLERVTLEELYGKTYEGGLIFYVNETDGTGLVAAPSDQANIDIGRAVWGCYGTLIDGADGVAIGTGAQNTLDILAGCNETGTAAKICADLVLNEKEDWFLPSKDELNAIYTKLYLNGFGGFALNVYWSSTENANGGAWGQGFANGTQTTNGKSYATYVRAVRAF